MSEVKSKLLLLTLSVVGMIIIFTSGLCYFEGWPAFTSLWVAVVSLTTTGYGELIPITVAGKIFTMFMLMTGIGLVLYFLSTAMSLIVENNFTMFMERDKTMEQIKRLENHVIVCGAGRVGSNAANILNNYQVPHVLIDIDESLVKQAIADGHLILWGDATRDEILIKAGIQKARGIICALSEDTLNVFVALSSRSLNPQLKSWLDRQLLKR